MLLNTKIELSRKKIKKTILFTIASKRIPYLGINLMKGERLIHWNPEKYFQFFCNKWKIQINGKAFHFHRLEDLILLKCPHRLEQTMTQWNPIKISTAFFIQIEKNSKIYMEPQKTPHSQRNLEKEDKARSITLPNVKL